MAAASSAPDPTPAADLGITAASLDVNLSGSVARDLEQLADAAAAAAAGEDLAPESPVRPAASVEAVEAAIETLEGEVLLKTEQLAEWEKLPGSLPNGMEEGIEDGGDGLEEETTTQILAQQVGSSCCMLLLRSCSPAVLAVDVGSFEGESSFIVCVAAAAHCNIVGPECLYILVLAVCRRALFSRSSLQSVVAMCIS